jgi:phospholipid/cholesterol/gamma-HCH transport system substrate-binding protein
MTDRALRFRLGLFVLAAIVLLGMLALWFGSVPGLFKSRHAFTITFADAPGLGPGSPVRRAGVRIGEVQSVELDDAGTVSVAILIDSRYAVRRNDRPTLVQGLIGGDAAIDLVRQEDGDPEPLEPGGTLSGIRQPNVNTLVHRASDVMPRAQDALSEVQQSLEKFERLAPLMEDTLKEYRDLARSTREVVPALGKTNDEVRELAHALRETVPGLRRTNEEIHASAQNWSKFGGHLDDVLTENHDKLVRAVDHLNDVLTRVGSVFNDDNERNLTALLQNVKTGTEGLDAVAKDADALLKDSRAAVLKAGETVAKADDAIGNVQQATKPLADRSTIIMKNLEESTDKLNKTMTDIQELVKSVEESDGTVRRLIQDPSLYNHLDEAICVVTKLLPRVDRILKDLEVFADKLARHPESIGLGGVVTPGSGSKK